MIFGQKLWILPYGKSHCLVLFKTLFFWSKNYSFFFQNIKKQYFWLISPKNTNKKNFDFWTKTMDYPLRKMSILDKNCWFSPLENLTVLHFLKLYFSSLKILLFFSRISKNNISDWFLQKIQIRKISIFGQKPWIIPLGKCPFFFDFLKL